MFLTLNLLCGSRANLKLSAYAYLYGNFDFNKTPLAPPGTKAMVHYKPIQRATWDPNRKVGWCIGPSLHHYRCMKFYMPHTRSELDKDTVVFIPHAIPIPETNMEDFIHQSTSDIITLLTQPPKGSTPITTLGNTTTNGLLQVATLLNRNSVPPNVLQKQHNLTLNAARHLDPAPLSTKPTSLPLPNAKESTKSPLVINADQQSILDEIKQLTGVLNKHRLARVLNAHKQL